MRTYMPFRPDYLGIVTDTKREANVMETVRVHLGTHAFSRATERGVPVGKAVEAVKRNGARLQELCPIGARVVLDFSEGRTVVEREATGRFAIITQLEWWMEAKSGQAIVFDQPKPSASRNASRPANAGAKGRLFGPTLSPAQRHELLAFRGRLAGRN